MDTIYQTFLFINSLIQDENHKIIDYFHKEDVSPVFNQYPIPINIRRYSKYETNNKEKELYTPDYVSKDRGASYLLKSVPKVFPT